MSQLGDTVRVGERGGVGVMPSSCKIIEYCDEPNRGLLVVEETRDSCPEHVYTFCVPYSWWDALVMAEEATRKATAT